MPESPTGKVSVVGLVTDDVDDWPNNVTSAIKRSSVIFGTSRLLDAWTKHDRSGATRNYVPIAGDLDATVQLIRARVVDDGAAVAVLASGDPGFFGILRSILRVIDRRNIEVVPAPSSVSVAFARLSLPWDDAVVVSAHGRPLDDATRAIRTSPKVAVLTSPDSPPEAVGAALLDAAARVDLVAVCSRLGHRDEEVRELTLQELSEGTFDPLSVVILVGPGALPITGWAPGRYPNATSDIAVRPRSLAWGRPEFTFGHRDGMITKSEVRAVVLGKLDLPELGVLWDVGAGSGSVGIEASLLSPSLTVFSIDSSQDDAARITSSAAELGAGVHVVCGHAPEALDDLPSPDRAFVGGGGIPVLEAVLSRLPPGGTVVATYSAIDRAAKAADLLGNLVQVNLADGSRLPDGGWRLAAKNPVFVAWGQRALP